MAKLAAWGSKSENFILLNSNIDQNSGHHYHEYDLLAAWGQLHSLNSSKNMGFISLKKFHHEYKDWIFGFFGYDLKNETENLCSKKPDHLEFPEISFCVPKIVFLLNGNILRIEYVEQITNAEIVNKIYQAICSEMQESEEGINDPVKIQERFLCKEYVETVHKIQKHIHAGAIYEANICQEFYSDPCTIDPIALYLRLNDISPAPFSVFLRNGDKYLISSSPERFLAKRGTKIISQPIKGTARRAKNKAEDRRIKSKLLLNEKERAENIMITDLVRNDLSKTAKKGSVKVEELCTIYSYEQVHQMISTITSEMDDEKYDLVDVIRHAFPMGSMTGAPKIRAMELIEQYEKTKRGIYSGAVGYIAPNKNFDFNVVIRSIVYNHSKKYLSFIVGSAITSQSVAEKEYEECLLKAKALKMALLAKI